MRTKREQTVILTATYSAFSGIDRVVELQARRLARAGHSVTIAAFDTDLPPPPGVTLIRLDAPKHDLALRLFRLFYPFLPWHWRRHLGQLGTPTTVIAHIYPLTALAATLKRQTGARFILHDHGLPPIWVYPKLIERAYMALFRLLAGWTYRSADEVVCVSAYLAREFARRYRMPARVELNRIDTSRFHPGLSGARVRQSLGIPKRAPVILFIGRLAPYKGVHTLISAFHALRTTLPDARLVVVGKATFPWYMARLRRLAQGAVTFQGFVSDDELPAYYAACDVYATATTWEGFNLPLAEAQACGKPVVAFDIGPHPEVVKYGTLVPVHDAEGFARALRTELARSG